VSAAQPPSRARVSRAWTRFRMRHSVRSDTPAERDTGGCRSGVRGAVRAAAGRVSRWRPLASGCRRGGTPRQGCIKWRAAPHSIRKARFSLGLVRAGSVPGGVKKWRAAPPVLVRSRVVPAASPSPLPRPTQGSYSPQQKLGNGSTERGRRWSRVRQRATARHAWRTPAANSAGSTVNAPAPGSPPHGPARQRPAARPPSAPAPRP